MRHRTVVTAALLFLLVSVACSPVAVAQEAAEPPQGTITVDFPPPGVPFGTFVKMISEQGDMQLLTTADIAKQLVSIYLADVTPKAALDAVLRAQGLRLDAVEGSHVMVIVLDEEDVTEQPLVTAYFFLEHLRATAEVGDLNLFVFDTEGEEAEDTQGEESIEDVLKVVLMEGAKGKSTSVKGEASYDAENGLITVRGTPEGVERARELINRLDREPQQVMIQATLASLTDDASQQLGLKWTPSAFARGAARLHKFPFSCDWVDTAEDAGAMTFGVLSFQDFLVELEALEADGDVRVLANPNIAVIEGKRASVSIADDIVVSKVETVDADLNTITEEVQRREVGVTLVAEVKVHANGDITLMVQPKVVSAAQSTFFDDEVDLLGRGASTIVRVADGQTIAIGGLYRTDEVKTERKVPFFGDIPYVGRWLFTYVETSERKTELVIFLTPRRLTPENIREDAEQKTKRIGVTEPYGPAVLQPHIGGTE